MPRISAEAVLQVVRALVARNLVEELNFNRKEAAEILGLTPAAVSQYLTGKRVIRLTKTIEGSKYLQQLVVDLSATLAERHRSKESVDPSIYLLDTSEKILAHLTGSKKVPVSAGPSRSREEAERRHGWIDLLRKRLSEEQKAASTSLEFAQRSKNDLIKALFRQIASDSLRHADIVSSLISYLQRGGERPRIGPLNIKELEAMISQEEAAGEASLSRLRREMDGAASLLLKSIDADERKHWGLLKGFLALSQKPRP